MKLIWLNLKNQKRNEKETLELIELAKKLKHFIGYEVDITGDVITIERLIYSREMRLLSKMDCMIASNGIKDQIEIIIFSTNN